MRHRDPKAHAAYMREWYRNNPEKLAANRRVLAAHQNHTAERADRRGATWTSSELDYVMSDELAVYEIAEMLGRTYRAVLNKRSELRRETAQAATSVAA